MESGGNATTAHPSHRQSGTITGDTMTANAQTRLHADLDDDLALAANTAQGLVAVGRSLRLALLGIESWRADPGRAGCLCRAGEELRVAITLVDGVTPPRLRRTAAWPGPADDGTDYPLSTIARILGRTARVLDRLQRSGVAREHGAPVGDTLDEESRRQCRTAWESAFHALVRVRAIQEAETWFSDSATDPWLLLAAEATPHSMCPGCVPQPRPRPVEELTPDNVVALPPGGGSRTLDPTDVS